MNRHIALFIGLFFSSQIAATSIEDSLVLHLPFDADLLDISGNSNHASWVNPGSFSNSCQGGAVLLDGIDDSIQVQETTNLDGFNAFTISLWFAPNVSFEAGVGRQEFFYKGPSPSRSQSYLLNYDDVSGALQFNVHSKQSFFNNSSIRYETTFDAGEWSHISITYDGINDLKMYVDGQVAGQDVGGITGQINDTSTPPLRIGGRTDDGTYFSGALDDFRLYDRELSENEVLLLSTYSCDQDMDGVIDAEDQCDATIVGDPVDSSGCSIAQTCPCDGFKNHGQYVGCTKRIAEEFAQFGIIDDAEAEKIGVDTAKNSCSKKKGKP